jgi:hypothetical protein
MIKKVVKNIVKNVAKGVGVLSGVGGRAGKVMRKMPKTAPKQNKPTIFPQKAREIGDVPRGRITPIYKPANPPMRKKTPMPKRKIAPPKKGVPMNFKNKNYKPSNGVGVGK